jgi:uncharacterized repeat protein (TIGR03803 family)
LNPLLSAEAEVRTSKLHNPVLGSLVLLVVCTTAAVAQPAKENLLYSFGTDGGMSDGIGPNGGLVFDSSGNIYGTTGIGGSNCTNTTSRCGTVFELSPSSGGGWSETVLYNFCQSGYPNCADGAFPESGLLMDASGNLFGTTSQGGTGPCVRSGGIDGCGTVFELSYSGGAWSYSVLYSFEGGASGDGLEPAYATLISDELGNLYGTTPGGGANGDGTVYEVSPPSIQGGAWTETVLHDFCQDNCSVDGGSPWGGVTLDSAGNLYGTTQEGAIDGLWGVLYELSPNPDASWTETVLYKFTQKHAGMSESGVSIDAAGNLYGTLSYGGLQDCDSYCGGVFRYSPSTGKEVSFLFNGQDGGNPIAGVLLNGDAAYGTTTSGAGTVFRIQGRTETVLYTFCARSHCADGGIPSPGALTQNSGRLYGTTSNGGRYNGGVVFDIVP